MAVLTLVTPTLLPIAQLTSVSVRSSSVCLPLQCCWLLFAVSVSLCHRRLPVTVDALGSKRACVNGDRQNTGFALKKLSAVGETNLM